MLYTDDDEIVLFPIHHIFLHADNKDKHLYNILCKFPFHLHIVVFSISQELEHSVSISYYISQQTYASSFFRSKLKYLGGTKTFLAWVKYQNSVGN